MLNLYDQVAARLKGDRCPALLQVETGMSADAIKVFALSERVSALVHPISDAAAAVNQAGSIVSQQETIVFGVTMAMAYPGGFPEFIPARDQIKAALRGWLFDGLATPIVYAGGQTLTYTVNQDGGSWLHMLRFSTTTLTTYEHQS